ncbi:MAG: hypothetical protein WAQ28_08595 [Bacteroidia bacterium]
MKNCFVIVMCMGITTVFGQNNTGAQQPPAKEKKIKVTDASIMGGFMNMEASVYGSLTDFQLLNPQSLILNENMDGYSSGYGYGGYTYDFRLGALNSGLFGANLGLSFKEKPKSLTQIRVGVAVSGTSVSNFISRTDRSPYDTLTSSQTGQTIYQDSITYHSYSMEYRARQLKLDVSLIYRMYPSARWSMYGGIGLQAGTSLSAYSDINYNEYVVIEGQESNGSYDASVRRSERFKNKNVQEFVAYIPVGVDFRLGKRKEFLKQIHLFTEIRPYVSVLNIPELGSFSGLGMQQVLGLRVTI